MPRLEKLVGNLQNVIPSVIEIALLFLLLQKGFYIFNLSTKFLGAGTKQHLPQFFYQCPQTLYLVLFVHSILTNHPLCFFRKTRNFTACSFSSDSRTQCPTFFCSA